MRPRHPSASSEAPSRACVYGRQPVREVLRAGRRRATRLTIQDTLRDAPDLAEILALAKAASVPIQSADRHTLDRLTSGGHHQGMLIDVGAYPYEDLKELIDREGGRKDQLWLLLDHLQDPQNVGALLRSAEAAGVTGVVIPADRAVEITDTVVRASAGASEHVRVCRVTNLVRAMKLLQEQNVWLYGLDAGAEAKLYTELDLKGSIGLVLGSEGEGLGRLVSETCDFRMQIPMLGRVGSLNASVAGAVALFEVVRQQGRAKR